MAQSKTTTWADLRMLIERLRGAALALHVEQTFVIWVTEGDGQERGLRTLKIEQDGTVGVLFNECSRAYINLDAGTYMDMRGGTGRLMKLVDVSPLHPLRDVVDGRPARIRVAS